MTSTVTIGEVAPVGSPPSRVTISEVSPVGVANTPRTVTISRVWVQLGDFPPVENRTRYLIGGVWIAPTSERIWSGTAWIPIL